MRRTTIVRGDADEPAVANGVVTHHPDHDRVRLSGLTWPEGTPAEQTRRLLAYVETLLERECDGDIADVTYLRFFLREAHTDEATREAIEAVEREFFDPPALPGTTMVGVADLLADGAAFELEVEAMVPTRERAVDWRELSPGGDEGDGGGAGRRHGEDDRRGDR
jgi:enamine deaminase RidA (YjgF/YER057c/UK114 family)